MLRFGFSLKAMGRAALLAAVVASGACSLMKGKDGDEDKSPNPSDELKLSVKLDKEAYRPGEAVMVEVTVTNATEKPIAIKALGHKTVTFWFGPVGQDRRLERDPVVSKKEAEIEADLRGGEAEKPLGPGETRSRRFLQTRLTGDAGSFIAQAHGDLFDDLAKQAGRTYSEPVTFRVEGERFCARDNEGLMMKEDAIRIAGSQESGTAPTASAARLIVDEMGFYKWWVNLDYPGEGGAPKHESWLIDPYTGRVWAKAQPFEPAKDTTPKPRIRGVEPK